MVNANRLEARNWFGKKVMSLRLHLCSHFFHHRIKMALMFLPEKDVGL